MARVKKRRVAKTLQVVFWGVLCLSLIFLFDYWRVRQGKLPYLRRWLPPYDYTFQSHQIDMAIESSLVKLGLDSDDIIKSYREEKKTGGKIWLYVYSKRIQTRIQTRMVK